MDGWVGEHCFLGWKIGDLDSVSKNVQWCLLGLIQSGVKSRVLVTWLVVSKGRKSSHGKIKMSKEDK